MALEKHRRWKIGAVLLVLFRVYVSSYLVLSHRAFARADEWDAAGFYFLAPRDSTAWRMSNYFLIFLYYPLISIDNALETSRLIAGEPLWNLSNGRPHTPPNTKEFVINGQQKTRFCRSRQRVTTSD